MKKLTALMMCLILLLTSIPALAGGLGGLDTTPGGSSTNGGGLDGLTITDPIFLPDPCLAMKWNRGQVGTLWRENYQFSADYLCDAYTYPLPESNFLSKYTRVLRDFGYTITETTIDGVAGYSIQCGDGYEALMILDLNGQLLFLVEEGMEFYLTNTLTCTYNDIPYSMYLYLTDTPNNYPYDCWGMTYKLEAGYFSYLEICVPKSARGGTQYNVPRDRSYYEGLKVSLDLSSRYLLFDSEFRSMGELESSRDYANIHVIKMMETPYGMLIYGTFEGRFSSGDDVFDDCEFCALIED